MLSMRGINLLIYSLFRFVFLKCFWINWLIYVNRYEKFFFGANDKFEVQRGLNNVFAYDLVPSVKVCEAALRACRRGMYPQQSRKISQGNKKPPFIYSLVVGH